MESNLVEWAPDTKNKFNQILAKIPVFLRPIAEKKVAAKAESLAQKQGRSVGEKDLIDALFLETPFGFHGPMKTDMLEVGLDYTKHGYDR